MGPNPPSESASARHAFVLLLVALGVSLRFLPHPPNVSPVAACALFAGAYLGSTRLALMVPMGIMLVSDVMRELLGLTGFHSHMPAVYLAFGLTTMLGFGALRLPASFGASGPAAEGLTASTSRRHTFAYRTGSIALRSLVGSVVFFVVTNLSVWLLTDFYPSNFSGLVTCYVAAIPFFRNSVLGDLFFNAVLFGTYAIASQKFRVLMETGPGTLWCKPSREC